jgi:hypothetical protein
VGRSDTKVRELLDQAALQVPLRFTDRPAVEAALQHTIGRSYDGLGLRSEALKHLRRAHALTAAQHGADSREAIELFVEIAGVAANLPAEIPQTLQQTRQEMDIVSKSTTGSACAPFRTRNGGTAFGCEHLLADAVGIDPADG